MLNASSNTFQHKSGLAQMLKNGVIMDVTNPEQAKIAEEAGAVAVMALERVPADIRREGGVARMSSPDMIQSIMKTVSIPVMAKARIGHFVEAQILDKVGVDFVDESEVLTVADKEKHIEKSKFKVPFVCGARNLYEALRRIEEGAAMIRTKGEAGTGDVSEAVSHIRMIQAQIEEVINLFPKGIYVDDPKLISFAAKNRVKPESIINLIESNGKLPVVDFAAGGIASPADAALCMQLGCDGVFVGSGIFKSSDPRKLAKAIVNAVNDFDDPETLLQCSKGLGKLMFGVQISGLAKNEIMATRG